jgi:uncharacterized protein (TIGR00251 family)
MIASVGDGVVLNVRVIPRAAKSEIAGTRANALLVRLNAPPVDDAANVELIEVISTTLGIPRRSVEIVSGHRSRTKRVRIAGMTSTAVAEKLCVPLPTS